MNSTLISKLIILAIVTSVTACATHQAQTARSAALVKKPIERQNEVPLTEAQAKQNNQEIKEKVEKNVVLPPSFSIKTLPVFTVTQKPTGEVSDVELKVSSGNAILDTAIMRAIWKSSPLPLPETGVARKQINIIWNPKNITTKSKVITL